MKTARILGFLLAYPLLGYSLLASPLLATNAFGQSSATAKAGAIVQVVERYVMPKGLPRPVPKTMHTAGLNFTIAQLDSNWQDVSDYPANSTHAFMVNVSNTSSDSESIYFNRTQLLPIGWTSSVCWGKNCYGPQDSTESYRIKSGGTALLTLDLNPAIDDVPDSCTIWLRVGVAGGATSDTVLLPFYATYLPPNPPLVFQWGGNPTFDQTYQGSGPWTLTDYFENHAGRGIDYSLSMQDSLPIGWSLTFCDKQNQNSSFNMEDTCMALGAPFGEASLTTNLSAVYDTTYQQPITFTLNAPAVSKEDSAVIYLSVHPRTSNPADSANYRFVMHVQPSSSVAGTSADRAGLAVTNAWPNPLMGSSALHLEILTDESGPAKAILYDLTGTQKATLDLGRLQEGTNELQLNVPSLTSGEYIIRVDQGGSASEVVRINYVK